MDATIQMSLHRHKRNTRRKQGNRHERWHNGLGGFATGVGFAKGLVVGPITPADERDGPNGTQRDPTGLNGTQRGVTNRTQHWNLWANVLLFSIDVASSTSSPTPPFEMSIHRRCDNTAPCCSIQRLFNIRNIQCIRSIIERIPIYTNSAYFALRANPIKSHSSQLAGRLFVYL